MSSRALAAQPPGLTPQPRSGTRLELLDTFRVVHRGVDVTAPVNARRLLAFLGVTGTACRAVVAGTLWPEVSQDRALGSLRTTIWRLHRCAPQLIQRHEDSLAIAPTVSVDLRVFTQVIGRVLHSTQPLDRAEEADLLRHGELLPGWYDDWVVFERERLHQLRMHALEVLAARLTAAGCHARALEAALECVRLQPLRESAHRAVVAVHLAENNFCEAVRHYERFRALLRAELGIEPSAQFAAMLPVQGHAAGGQRGAGHAETAAVPDAHHWIRARSAPPASSATASRRG